MSALQICPQCGAKLSGDGPSGSCPACLIGLAIVPDPDGDLDQSAIANQTSKTKNSPSLRYFGDYELLEEIARGGMGIVYRARQVSLNRPVALKMILSGQLATPDSVQRFHTEAEAAARLDHPNIVPIYEIGEYDGHHYFSMKLIEGGSLAQCISSLEFPISNHHSAQLLAKLARAVHYAHQRGILHRDLKPTNILIDKNGEPHVTDFGLAKLLGSDSQVSTLNPQLTQSAAVLGTPTYMAPEQAAGRVKQLTTAGDVYSVGAIFYELLTGRAPFQAETMLDLLRKVYQEEPLPPRALNPKVDQDLETVCLKCLSKDPKARYGSAELLADDLDRWRNREPILAHPLSTRERLWCWCRRKPAIAGLLATLILVFLVGVSGVFIESRRAELQRKVAETKTALVRTTQYAHEMNLALRAADDGDWRRAVYLLQEQRRPGEIDLRGFEWRHLWWRCRGDYKLALPKHNQVVGDLAFSPNGKLLGTFAWDNTLRIWSLNACQVPLLTVTNVSAMGAFSADGRRFLMGRRDGAITEYPFETRALTSFFPNAGELVAVSADGNTIVTLGQERRLSAWVLGKQRMIFRLPETVRRRLDDSWNSGIALPPAGNVLAVVEQRIDPLHADPGIRLWDVQAGRQLKFLSMSREIRCLQFSPDGKMLAVGDGDGTVWIWDMALFESQTFRAHDSPVLALAFSPDGQNLATGSSDESIRVWNVSTKLQTPRTFRGQAGPVWSLAFSPDGLRLASGGRDSNIKIWTVNDEDIRDTVTNLHSTEWGNFTFSPDSKLIAAGCQDHMVRVWAVETLEEVASLPGATFAVAFSGNGKKLLVASLNERPAWWDLESKTSTPLPSYNGRMQGRVSCVDLSPDRRTAALGLDNGNIQLLDIHSGLAEATFPAHDGGVGSLAFSPSGQRLMSGGRDKSVAVWDTRTQRKLGSSSEHRGSVCAVAVSRDGSQFASACGANTIKLWNAEDLTKSLATISYHKSGIRTLSFSPAGETLASGSADNTVKLWSVGSHLEVASFKLQDHVRLVSFSPDGNILAVVTDKGTMRLFRAVSLDQADVEAAVMAQ